MPDVAAEIAVPLPLSTPVILVVIVIAGVVVALATVPVNPLVETTETVVTDPEPLPLNVVQSVDVKYPLTEEVAAGILIAGVAPPEDTIGAVPVTEVTVPAFGVVQDGVVPLVVNTLPLWLV